MPPSKLTLLIDERVVSKAKRYGRRHGVSLSRMVTRFLSSLPEDGSELTPKVRQLSGLLPRRAAREDYRAHLLRKYSR